MPSRSTQLNKQPKASTSTLPPAAAPKHKKFLADDVEDLEDDDESDDGSLGGDEYISDGGMSFDDEEEEEELPKGKRTRLDMDEDEDDDDDDEAPEMESLHTGRQEEELRRKQVEEFKQSTKQAQKARAQAVQQSKRASKSKVVRELTPEPEALDEDEEDEDESEEEEDGEEEKEATLKASTSYLPTHLFEQAAKATEAAVAKPIPSTKKEKVKEAKKRKRSGPKNQKTIGSTTVKVLPSIDTDSLLATSSISTQSSRNKKNFLKKVLKQKPTVSKPVPGGAKKKAMGTDWTRTKASKNLSRGSAFGPALTF